MPKVSVLVPIFNVEQYLEECLDSIVNQTLEDIEIICINDGSTDSSLKIIKKYAKTDPRFVIIDKKNSGYGDSMNRGLKKSNGKYIAIVESDDWIEKNTLKTLYDIAESNDVEVVKSNYYDYYTTPEKQHLNGAIFNLIPSEDAGRVIDPRENTAIFWQKPAIWTGMYRKDFLEKNRISFLASPGASYQDTGFNFKVLASARKVFLTQEAFLHYRQDNEASSINNPGKVFCVSDEYKEIEQFLKENDLLDYFGSIMRIAKWGAYAWNIDRLKADLAEEFILKASSEYKEDLESGVFNFEHCGPNQVRVIRELIENPKMTIARKYASEHAKVAIIVPCYNVEDYVSKAVESALSQTYKDIEIILVDDGSTDNTPSILEGYFVKDPRIKVVNTANGGLSAARNNGISQSTAPYLAFLDSDDYYEPSSIENLLNNLEENDSDVSVGSIRVIYNDNQLTAIEKNNDYQYYIVKLSGKKPINTTTLSKTDVSSCNKLFRRSIIERFNIHYPYGLKYEDAYFFNTYCMVSETISYLPRDTYVYNYVRRSDSIMANTFSKTSASAADHLEIAIGIFDFMVRNDLVQEWGDYYAGIFDEYYNFALRWSSQSEHNKIIKRAQGFIEYNSDNILLAGDDTLRKIKSIIPQQSIQSHVGSSSKIPQKIKYISKKAAKKILKKVSPTYKNQKATLEAINNLHEKISSLEKRQQALEKAISKVNRKSK